MQFACGVRRVLTPERNPYNCDTTCNETLSEYYDTATESDGSEVFTILQNLEQLDGTCDAVKGEIETEVCNVANCCSYCVDEFEEVVECATQLFTSDGCDIECGTNEEWKPSRGGGRRKKQRKLQTTPSLPNGGGGVGVDGPPDFSQVEVPGPISEKLQSCQDEMSAQFAVGMTDVAFDTYMSCVTTTVLNNLPRQQEEDEDGSDTTSDASSSNESTSSSSAVAYVSIMFTLLPFLSIAVVAMW